MHTHTFIQEFANAHKGNSAAALTAKQAELDALRRQLLQRERQIAQLKVCMCARACVCACVCVLI